MSQYEGSSSQKFQLDSLDGLRGTAVLFVFLSHTSNTGVHMIPGWDFSGIGTYGVFLFFILSSFLLTYPFLIKQKQVLSKAYFLNYFLRRFLRIYPLYIFYLLLALLSTSILLTFVNLEKPIGIPFPLTFDELLRQLSLQQGKSITWSIIVEFRYYFLLPVIAIIYSVIFKNKLLPSFLFTALIIYISLTLWPHSESISKIEFTQYLPIFFTGSFLAILHFNWQNYKSKMQKCRNAEMQKCRNAEIIFEILGIISLISIITLTPSILKILSQQDYSLTYLHSQFFLFSLLWGTVLFSTINGAGILKVFFEICFLRYIGFISFSFYLWHLVGIRIIKQTTGYIPDYLSGWAILAVTIIISHITYKKIEMPMAKVRFSKK